MTTALSGATKWKPRLVQGEGVLEVHHTCPTCKHADVVRLGPLPWRVPAEGELHPDHDGRLVVDLERRAAGKIKHVATHQVTTQLWCHHCGQGAEVQLQEA
jgi:transcription elongation factor Elf1